MRRSGETDPGRRRPRSAGGAGAVADPLGHLHGERTIGDLVEDQLAVDRGEGEAGGSIVLPALDGEAPVHRQATGEGTPLPLVGQDQAPVGEDQHGRMPLEGAGDGGLHQLTLLQECPGDSDRGAGVLAGGG